MISVTNTSEKKRSGISRRLKRLGTESFRAISPVAFLDEAIIMLNAGEIIAEENIFLSKGECI
jgi:hypothetical protein